jgi:3-hydroxyisobutyrate dehydrogenase
MTDAFQPSRRRLLGALSAAALAAALPREYSGGFQVDLMNKDLGLAMEASLKSKSSTPMGSLAKSLYAAHARLGSGKLDFSSIQRFFRKN